MTEKEKLTKREIELEGQVILFAKWLEHMRDSYPWQKKRYEMILKKFDEIFK